MLNLPMTFRLLVMIVKVHLILGNNRIFLIMVKFMVSIGLNAENTENTWANSKIKLQSTKLQNFAMQRNPMKSYFGNI